MSRLVVLFAVAVGFGATALAAPPKATLEFAAHLTGSVTAGFSPDGKRFASAGPDAVTVHDAATGRPTARLTGHVRGAVGAAFVAGDKLLASTGRDETVRVWDLATEKELWRGSHAGVAPMIATPDGKHLLTGGEDETLRVWDVATGKEVAAHRVLARVPLPENVPNGRGITSLRLSPDGKSVVVAGFDRAVKVFSLADVVAPG